MLPPKLISTKIKKALRSKTSMLLTSILTQAYVTISDAFTRYAQGFQSTALIVPFYNYNPQVTLNNCTKIMRVNS